MVRKSIKDSKPIDLGKAVIRFYELVGYTLKDKTVIGDVHFKMAWNTIRDIPKFFGKTDQYICIHPLRFRRLKANVTRVFTCFIDFDFKDHDLALAHIEKIKAVLDRYGFYYGIVHSGRGLHLYVPVGNVGGKEIEQLNIHLNRIIFSEYIANGIIDTKPIRNYSTFLRLPGTINSKSGKKTFIAFQNLEAAAAESIDYFAHNHQIILNSIAEHESEQKPVPATRDHFTEIDYKHSFFKWNFFEQIISGGARYEVLQEIVSVLRAKEDRELNNILFSNLAIYIRSRSSKDTETERFIKNAIKFIKTISDDPDDPSNLKRWLNLYDEREGTDEPLQFNSVALLNWAARMFPGTIVHKLIKDDSDRLYRHNAYFTFLEENMTNDSVEQIRARWNDFAAENIYKPGFHWGVLETGLGKTDQFLKLFKAGKNVVIIVPYVMLKLDIEREIGTGSVFTLDAIRSGDNPHKMRHDLLLKLMRADIVVVDEAHCLDLHYTLKPQIMDEFNDTLRRVAVAKPVFMLTGTPSVDQIITISDPNASKILAYLRKVQKRISIRVIDREGLECAFRDHDRILIFIDDRRQITALQSLIEEHIKPDHRVFPIHSKISLNEKKTTEREIRGTNKWVIIGTSSVVSGLNIDRLETIVFSNLIINQQNLYQCMGRLRIVNRLDTVHPIYIMSMTEFKNPRAGLDMFEYVSPASIIKYLSKLYHVTGLISCDSKICSFSRLKNFEDWKRLIRSAPDIRAYYALDLVQAENLYPIPMEIIRELQNEGFFEDHPKWLNVAAKSILYTKNGEQIRHKAIIEWRSMGIKNSFRHYLDPIEFHIALSNQNEPKKELPKPFRDVLDKIRFFKCSTMPPYSQKPLKNSSITI